MDNERNPTFKQILNELSELHHRKSHDYASDQNVYSNFEYAASEAGVSVLTVFRVIIGIKDARIKELLNSGKTPSNELVMDTWRDRVVYTILMMGYERDHANN